MLLEQIILGTNFFKQTETQLKFSKEICQITALLQNKRGSDEKMELMVNVKTCLLNNLTEVT